MVEKFYHKKLIIFCVIIFFLLPLYGKAKKGKLISLLNRKDVKKEPISPITIIKKNRNLALNYIKIREHTKVNQKRRFRVIFRASIKHILENKEHFYDFKPEKIEKENILVHKQIGNKSLTSLQIADINKDDFSLNLGLYNIQNPKHYPNRGFYINSSLRKKFISLNLEGFRELFDNKNYFVKTGFTLNNINDFYSTVSLWRGKPFTDLLFNKNKGFEKYVMGEEFIIGKTFNDFDFQLLQSFVDFGERSMNSFGISLRNNTYPVSGYLAGGYIYELNKEDKDSLYFKVGASKNVFNKRNTISFEYPFFIDKEKNLDYFKTLYYMYIPSMKIKTYIPFIEAELFFNLYYNNLENIEEIIYMWGIRKF